MIRVLVPFFHPPLGTSVFTLEAAVSSSLGPYQDLTSRGGFGSFFVTVKIILGILLGHKYLAKKRRENPHGGQASGGTYKAVVLTFRACVDTGTFVRKSVN